VEAPLSLTELVEDELLLAMPMSPGHTDGQCEAAYPVTVGKTPVTEKRANPFAELRGFKGKISKTIKPNEEYPWQSRKAASHLQPAACAVRTTALKPVHLSVEPTSGETPPPAPHQCDRFLPWPQGDRRQSRLGQRRYSPPERDNRWLLPSPWMPWAAIMVRPSRSRARSLHYVPSLI